MMYLSADKHGLPAIRFVEKYLNENQIAYQYIGVKDAREDVGLESLIPPFVAKVKANFSNKGIISCGTGIGVEVGVNKFAGIRACLATTPKLARWASVYDKCNVLCLPGWECTKENIYAVLDAWFGSSYDGDSARLNSFKIFDSWH